MFYRKVSFYSLSEGRQGYLGQLESQCKKVVEIPG